METVYANRHAGATLRSPPHNIEAEQALLGAILLNNEAHDRVSSFLQPEHFFDPVHANIYEVVAKLIGAGKRATPISLRTFFETAEPIAPDLTVPQYLGRLGVNATTIINAADYGRTIHDLFIRRQLIQVCEDLREAAFEVRIDEPVSSLVQLGTDAFARLRDWSFATLTPVTFTQLRDRHLTSAEWVVEDLIYQRGIAMVYAWRGGGKTWFALGLGFAIATGSPFLRWKVGRPHRVLHVCGEMPAVALRDRLLHVSSNMNALPSNEHYRILSSDLHDLGLPDLSSAEGQHLFDQSVGDAEVIILDNVSTLFRSGVENDAESWASVQCWLLAHRRQGRSIIIIHHAGKGRAQRGTSKREDILDLVLNLRAPADYKPHQGARFEVHFEKYRGLIGDQVKPFEVQLDVVAGGAVWVTNDVEEARAAEIEVLRADGLSIRAIAREMNMSSSSVHRATQKFNNGGAN